MKEPIVKRKTVLVKYFTVNWKGFLFPILFGSLFLWIISVLFDLSVLADKIQGVWEQENYQVLIVSALILIVLLPILFHNKLTVFFDRYKRSYYLSDAPFILIDGLLLFFLPLILFLCFFIYIHYSNKEYFFHTAIFLFIYILVAKVYFIGRDVSTKDSSSIPILSIQPDEPIDDASKDLVNRKRFVEALRKHIDNLPFQESIVIGLYGIWGEGKSSVLHLFRREIDKNNNVLVYEFDPWFFGSKDAIIKNFYYGLKDLLSESYLIPKKIRRIFSVYPKLLISGFVSFALDFKEKSEDRPIEVRKNLESFVAKLNKRILVIIDDIDRLQRNEILEVFRLVKMTSNMKNIVFLLAFDPCTIIHTLDTGESYDKYQKYIDKIIQIPIYLPLTDQKHIDKYLLYSYPAINYRSEIDKIMDVLKIKKEERKEFDDLFVKTYQQTGFRQLFNTFRAAKRYINSISFRLPFIVEEVFLYDFFILEVFQTFFSKIYNDIRSNPYYYVSHWNLEIEVHSPLPINDEEKRITIKEHIENLIKEEKCEKLIFSLLESIFPSIENAFSNGRISGGDSGEYRVKRRIAHPDCFDKYFMLSTRDDIVSDASFDNELNSWLSGGDIESRIEKSFFKKYQKKNQLIDFIEKLKLYSGYEKIDQRIVMPLINVIYKNCSKFQKEGDFWTNEFHLARGLLLRLIEDNKIINEEEIQDLIEKILNNISVECLDFAVLIVSSLNESRGADIRRIFNNIDIKYLKTIMSDRLKKYFIEDKNDIFVGYKRERDFGFILFQWATNWEDKLEKNSDMVTNYVLTLMDEKPQYLGYFLSRFTREERFGINKNKKIFDFTHFQEAYNIKLFHDFIKRSERKSVKIYSTKDEREAIKLFVKSYEDSEKVKRRH